MGWPLRRRGPVRRSRRSAGHALSIALGTEDPFASSGADVPSVPLAIVSWLLVPTLVGAAVALLVDEHLRAAAPFYPDPQADLDGIAHEGGLRRFPSRGGADEGPDDPGETR